MRQLDSERSRRVGVCECQRGKKGGQTGVQTSTKERARTSRTESEDKTGGKRARGGGRVIKTRLPFDERKTECPRGKRCWVAESRIGFPLPATSSVGMFPGPMYGQISRILVVPTPGHGCSRAPSEFCPRAL